MTINIGFLVLILGFLVVLPLIYIGFTGKTEDNRGNAMVAVVFVTICTLCYTIYAIQGKHTVNTDELIKFNHSASETIKSMTVAEKYDAMLRRNHSN